MKALVLSAALLLTSCTSKPSRLLGRLPADAGETFGAICAAADSGLIKPDEDLKAAKGALMEKTLVDGLEGVRCAPTAGPDPQLNSLVFDHATRRLFAVSAIVRYADVPLLDKLVLPALSESERAGYEFVRMRQAAPWMDIEAENRWTDGHTVIWMAWTDSAYKKWPPNAGTTFEVQVTTKK